MFRKSLIVVFIVTQLFAQSSMVVPFVSPEHVGMQISPVVGGIKSSFANQETELNIILYYHNSFLVKEDDVIGRLEGRLISEMPLSSFDMLDQIKSDRSLILSNYGEQYKIYQEALKEFRTFQESDPEAILNDEYYYDEDYYYDEEEQQGVNNENAETISQIQLTNFQKIKQSFVAQSTDLKSATNYQIPLISGEELERLIYLERLKQQYQSVVSQYNALLVDEATLASNYTFDPADPAEQFTVTLVGDNISGVWSKSFRLDGIKTYQSYNSQVWYLGYQIPITKKDMRSLYSLFTKNNRVRYVVGGTGGVAEFNLSTYFINAVKELFQLYGQGKFKRDMETTIPLLRD